MAITSLEKRKKQNVLLITVLAICIVALVVLYFAFWQKKTPATTDLGQPTGQLSNTLEEELKKIDLDTSFLIDKIIPFLKSHGNLPVNKGITGKPNPFAP